MPQTARCARDLVKKIVLWLLVILASLPAWATPAYGPQCQGLFKRYLRLHPPKGWDYDWTTAVFLYGAIKYLKAHPDPQARAQIQEGFKALAADPPDITMPDLAALALPAQLWEGPEAQKIQALSRAYFQSEPQNAIGAIDHVGQRHRFFWFMPPTARFVPSSVWADSMIMAVLTGHQLGIDPAYFLRQAEILHAKLIDPSAGLYKHAYYVKSGERYPHKHFWARGNMWMALGMVELLGQLPFEHAQHALLKQRLSHHLTALATFVTPQGLRTLIDDPTSDPESSATALLAYVLLRSERLGVPVPHLSELKQRALAASFAFLRPIGEGEYSMGNISGPTTAFKYPWYYRSWVGTRRDESYGVGSALLVCSEL